MSDPSSPSTSSARDAVVEAMRDWDGTWDYCTETSKAIRLAEIDGMLDAALGVTYATPCPTCAEPNMALGTGPDYRDGCPSCNGSGRSAPRLALIDVLVAQGALEAVTGPPLAGSPDAHPCNYCAEYDLPYAAYRTAPEGR